MPDWPSAPSPPVVITRTLQGEEVEKTPPARLNRHLVSEHFIEPGVALPCECTPEAEAEKTPQIDMVTLLYLPHQSSNLMKVYVPLICGQRKINAVSWKVKPMIWKEMICGLSKENFL